MALRCIIYKSLYRYRSTLITDFFVLEHQIIAGKAPWGPSLFLYGEFAYIPFIRNGRSRCSRALISVLGTALFTRSYTPPSILAAVMLMSCALSVGVGVLPPTPSTPYPDKYRSLYGTCIGLVVF